MGRTHRGSASRTFKRPSRDGAFGITDYAVEQLRQRHMPSFTFDRVRVEAKILAATARRTDRRAPDGAEIWEATDGYPIAFVVKNDQGRRVCVTVLPRATDTEESEQP